MSLPPIPDVEQLIYQRCRTYLADNQRLAVEELMRDYALAATEKMRAERDALREDAERARFMLKNASWHRDDEERRTRLCVQVPYGSDLSCYAMRQDAIDAARKA